MAAIIGNLPIKILAQAPNCEPAEIGTCELPIHIGSATPAEDNIVNVHMTVGDIDPERLARTVARRLESATNINDSL